MPKRSKAAASARKTNGRQKSILIATTELLGWGEPTEPAGAMTALAQQLVRAGEKVTLLWVPGREQVNEHQIEHLKKYYFEQFMIHLKLLEKSDRLISPLWTLEKQSVALLHHLQFNKFDVAYVAIEGGLGYYPLLGKETGVFPNRPPIVVVASSPIAWQSEAERRLLTNMREVTAAHMEKYCAELADQLVCLSVPLVEWMKKEGWKLPGDTRVLPPLAPGQWRFPSSLTADPPKTGPAGEIVLLAGPDFREGTTLFCDVIDKLADSIDSEITITAIGPFGQILGEHTGGMLLRRARQWPFKLHLVPNLGFPERLDYVRKRRAIAIVPSLANATGHWVSACLDSGVPFVATAVGANEQLVSSEDEKRCLARTNAGDIAKKALALLKRPRPADARLSRDSKRDAWVAAMQEAIRKAARKPRISTGGKQPLVSVVMVHHNRAQYVLQAIDAVEKQTYKNVELILVDDGSDQPEAVALLDRIEPKFKKRKWKIVRQENKYLGAARNNGVKHAKGEMILFVDDDNALFPTAVETYVRAMQVSGSDICTAFQMLFYEEFIPDEEDVGYIQYIPLGGSLDLGMIHDSYGDANAMIRRSVFDRIGFQYDEYGYTAQDWEFFARASLEGLKLRIIPEPLYWYRSSAQGMYRNSHWYDNRKPVMATYRRHKYAGLEYIYHLAISKNVTETELQGYRENLRYSRSDEKYLQLCELNPNSYEALEKLAGIAAAEGRPETALFILGRMQHEDFGKFAAGQLESTERPGETVSQIEGAFSETIILDFQALKKMAIRESGQAEQEPLFYVEQPDRLLLEAMESQPTIAVLAAGCPAGTISVTTNFQPGDETAGPCDCLIMLAPVHEDAGVAVAGAKTEPGKTDSGWRRVSQFGNPQSVSLNLVTPIDSPANLILAVRSTKRGKRTRALGCFDSISIQRALGWEALQRPRTGAPPQHQRARRIEDDELKNAKLLTPYESELPLLLVDKHGGGVFLRPSQNGIVAAALPWAFPPFARRVVAEVEIAHDEASDFEFAMALSRPDDSPDWSKKIEPQVASFSGWTRVKERYKLQTISLDLEERSKFNLSIILAIRLPRGSKPAPANAFWRKVVLSWED